jgi:hypothetical protein
VANVARFEFIEVAVESVPLLRFQQSHGFGADCLQPIPDLLQMEIRGGKTAVQIGVRAFEERKPA